MVLGLIDKGSNGGVETNLIVYNGRVLLQNYFFPSSFRDAVATSFLSPNEYRLHTELKARIHFVDPFRLVVPIRETSKDWSYPSAEDDNDRKPGYLQLKGGSGSFVHVIIPMILTSAGYRNTVNANFVSVEASTSVEHLLTTSNLLVQPFF